MSILKSDLFTKRVFYLIIRQFPHSLSRQLDCKFITFFEKQCLHNTVWIYMMPLRRMITIAQNHGWIIRDPFVDYSISAESTDRDYLTKDEIRQLLDLKFRRKSMELARDLYVFCCFTGLSFTDMKNLTKDNLQTSFDGKLRITTKQSNVCPKTLRITDGPHWAQHWG